AQLETVRQHAWTAIGGIALVLEAVRVYDDLAVQLDPGYVSDWSVESTRVVCEHPADGRG
ncbi:hypothetical protein, partial [Ramlibacter cellulosilyticus]|uniref:hypothetical protein n=1 Tax=Ramlibacter cellulosilyticus TaxID=2764187 RepID=UPI001C9B73BD